MRGVNSQILYISEWLLTEWSNTSHTTSIAMQPASSITFKYSMLSFLFALFLANANTTMGTSAPDNVKKGSKCFQVVVNLKPVKCPAKNKLHANNTKIGAFLLLLYQNYFQYFQAIAHYAICINFLTSIRAMAQPHIY